MILNADFELGAECLPLGGLRYMLRLASLDTGAKDEGTRNLGGDRDGFWAH